MTSKSRASNLIIPVSGDVPNVCLSRSATLCSRAMASYQHHTQNSADRHTRDESGAVAWVAKAKGVVGSEDVERGHLLFVSPRYQLLNAILKYHVVAWWPLYLDYFSRIG